jgi:hypothetical protein
MNSDERGFEGKNQKSDFAENPEFCAFLLC